MCNTSHSSFFEDHEKDWVSTARDCMKIKELPSPRILEQMKLLIALITICSNLKYGYGFLFAEKLKLCSTQEMESSKSHQSLKWGTQEYTCNEQKAPALAEYCNSFHYFVTTL